MHEVPLAITHLAHPFIHLSSLRSLDDGATDRFQLLPHGAGLGALSTESCWGSHGPAGEAEDGDPVAVGHRPSPEPQFFQRKMPLKAGVDPKLADSWPGVGCSTRLWPQPPVEAPRGQVAFVPKGWLAPRLHVTDTVRGAVRRSSRRPGARRWPSNACPPSWRRPLAPLRRRR